MPKLPTIESRTTPSGTIGARRLSAQEFGSGVGDALIGVGQIMERRAVEEDRTNVNNRMSALRTELTDAFLQQSGRKDGDLSKFSEEFDAYIVKRTENMQDEFNTHEGRMLADNQINDLRQSFLQKSIQYQVEATRQNTILKYEDTLNNMRNVLVSDPTQFGEVLKQQQSYIEGLSLESNSKAKLQESAARGMAMSAVQGTILTDPSIAEAELKSGKWDKYLDADAKARFLASIASAKTKNKSEAKAAISNARARMQEGLAIPGEESGRISLLVESTGDAEIANDWNILRAIQNQNSQLRTLRPQDAQAYINGSLAPKINDTATQAEYELFDSANKMLSTMRSEIERDPMSWASRAGVVGIKPLTEPGAYNHRAEVAQQVSDFYGVKAQPFTADEASEITRRLDSSTPTEQIIELKRMVEGLGSLSGPGLAQLGNENGMYAHAGSLLLMGDQNTGIVMSMLEGAKMLRDDKKNAQALDGETGAGLAFTTRVGNTFQNVPKMQSAVRAFANALYVRMAAQEGTTKFDSELYKQAVSLSLGGNGTEGTGIGAINGTSFVLPAGVNEDSFERAISRMSPEDLARYSEGGAPPRFADGTVVTAEQIADEGRFQFIGHGRYAVTMQDGGFLLGSGLNGYYVLNLGSQDIKSLNSYTKEELKRMGIAPEAP